MVNELCEIPVAKWEKLRDLYCELKDRASSYNTLQTFIEWKNKEPEFAIEIFALNGDWESDGTFVAITSQQVFCNTLNQDCSRLVAALNCLDISKYSKISGFPHKLLLAIEKHFRQLDLKTKDFHPNGTFWMHLPKQEALELSIDLPPNIILQSLNESHAGQINRIWPHRSDDSIDFVKLLIRLNKNIGLFEGEHLVAWCLILPLGSLGLLQVEEAYKRKGLGNLAVRYMSKLLAENDVEVTAPVVFTNSASRAMFEKLGFKIIDKVYWLEI